MPGEADLARSRSSSDKWKRIITKCFFIPQRYVLTLMGFLAFANGYAMRLSLSVTITQMVESPIYLNLTDKINEPICPFEDYNYMHRNDVQAEQSYHSDGTRYDWSQKLQGIILSSFYWGYITTQIPGGILSQRFGGKHVLTIGLVFTALCTLVTPIAVQYGGVMALITLRVLMGIGEGIMYSSLTVLLSVWVPLGERTTLGCFAFGGSTVGTIGGSYISAEIIHKYRSWHPVFYFFGTLTLIWSVVFSLICYNSPESHPFIKAEEVAYLQRELGYETMTHKHRSPPWRHILTSVPFLALIVSIFGQDFSFAVIVLDLPKYMNDVLHFSIQDNGLYTSMPQLLKLIVALATGALSDWLISSDYMSITNARKIFIAVSSVISGAFIVLASYAECDKLAVVIYFTISIVFQGVPGPSINPLDLSPNYAGILVGIATTVGGLTGVIAPYVVGVVTPHSLLTEWRLIFWITFVLQIVKAVVFTLWGSGEVQHWNSPDEAQPLLKAKAKALSLGGPSGLYGSARTVDGILPSAVSYDDILYYNSDHCDSMNHNKMNVPKLMGHRWRLHWQRCAMARRCAGYSTTGPPAVGHQQVWKKRALRTGIAVLAAALAHDSLNEFQYCGGAGRFLRSMKIAAHISFDYSWHLYGVAESSDEYTKLIKEINLRSAKRLLDGCLANGGLYIKIGQGVSAINHILPPEYTNTLKQLENECLPRKPDEVKQLFRQEFGHTPDELFAEFNYEPIAAASLAQVFRAKRHDGRDVAVKVQYIDLLRRFNGDFATIQFLLNIVKAIHRNFNFCWILQDLRGNLEQELDFIHEGKNAERCAIDMKKFSYVHIPEVDWDLTSTRVLTAEWIDGYKISDVQRLRADKFDLADIDRKLFDVFSEQIFNTGFVHADPHPGNVFVRKNAKTGAAEIVLLDHGLYEFLPEPERLSLCQFWEAIVLKDTDKMQTFSRELNVEDFDKLAEILLQRPLDMSGPLKTRLTADEIAFMQEMAKKRFDTVLNTLKLMPRSMLFVVRNLNTIRAIARHHGDPLDRPAYMARYAQRCIYRLRHGQHFPSIKWLVRRIRFDYHFFKLRLRYWWIRAYLNALSLVGCAPRNASDILNFSPADA